ncbi:hypothetical protein BH23ACT11_BH23ACT11_29880 [soil metagenome]
MGRLLLLFLLIALMVSGCGGGKAGAPSDPGSGSEDASPKTSAATDSVENGKVGETVPVEGGSFTRVPPEELKTMIDEEEVPLVNVHIPFEGDIPDTDLSIPYNKIDQNTGRLPAKDEKIVLYCRSGGMSAEASKTLVGLGYTNVWDFGGGMNAWQQSGYQLEGT